jgi:hypothetical protein
MAINILGKTTLPETIHNSFTNNKINSHIYEYMLFADMHSFKTKLYGRFLKVFLPVSFLDKLKVIKHYSLDRNSIMHRENDTRKSGIDFTQLFNY